MAGTDFSHLTNDELIKGIQALNLPDYIRSKAYGIDVRETLAQMTEMTIQLGVNMGLSPDDALKWARKLQESVSQSEFDSWVATLLDGGPSIFMNTLSELQSTYPNGAAGVALVRETDPAKIYVWNGSAWEDFGAYQGIEVKDGTITPRKTNFFYISKNLFDKTNVILGKGINTSTGMVEDNANNFVAELDLEPGTYTVNNFNRGGVRIAQYNASGDLHVMGVYLSGDSFNVAGKDAVTKIIISSSQGNLGDDLMINEGEIALPYEPYDNVYIPTKHIEPLKNTDIEDGLITPNKTNFFHISKNLFDKTNVILGKGINSSSGIIEANETNFIAELDLAAGTYTVNNFNRGGVRIAQYNSFGDLHSMGVYLSGDSFTVPDKDVVTKIIISTNQANLGDDLMINEGDNVLPYEEYGKHTILPQFLPEQSENETNNDVYFAPLAVDKSYVYSSDSINVEALDGTGVNAINHKDVTVDLIYGMYDDLMSEFPDNITREQLGTDESGTYPIYKYRFKPNQVVNTPRSKIHKDLPVLSLITGTHGPGMEAGDLVNNIFILYWVMKDVYTNWKQNEIFDWFRQNVTIDVIPTLNPWGVDNHDRKNSRGVDINRNFDASGWYSGEPTSTQYGGVEPFSEAESKALLNYVNSTDNISLLMDFHTVGGSSDPAKFIYFSADTSNALLPIAEYHIKRLSSKWKQHRTYLDSTIENYGYIHNAGSGGMISKWADEQGIPSIIIETAPDMPNSGQSRNNQVIMELGYENLSNWLFHVVNHLAKH